MTSENHQLMFCLVVMTSLFIQVSALAQYADAQDIEVGVEAEIGADESSSEVSSETKAEGSAEIESSENEEAMAKSEMEGKTSMKTSYPKISASSESQVVIQSRQMLYQPGDTITVEGSLWSSLMSQLGQSGMVTVQVLDSEGNVVNEKTAKVSGQGDYGAQIEIPPNSVGGEYTIRSEIVADSSVLAVLGDMSADLDSSSSIVVSVPTVVTVSAEGHGDFDVEIASSSDVSQVEFSAQEKTLAFQVEGETGTKGVTQIKIPKQLLSGQITVLIDGQIMASDDVIMTTDTEAETVLEMNYSHSAHTVEIIGTNAVPEFGQLSVLVLITATAAITIAGMKKGISIGGLKVS